MSTGGVVLLVGSAVFLLGAAIAVPGVFTTDDRDERARLLADHVLLWRLGQPLCAGGALLAGMGVAVLGDAQAASGWSLLGAGALLVAGALAWSWSTYLRGRDPGAFLRGDLPGWPFAAYVVLTLAGLGLLGVALLVGPWPAWLGWLVVGADAVFLAAVVRYRDLPPFVFYVLLIVVALAA